MVSWTARLNWGEIHNEYGTILRALSRFTSRWLWIGKIIAINGVVFILPGWLRYINDNIFDFNQVLRRHSRLCVWTKNLVFDNSANVFRADRKLYLRPDAHTRIIEDISRLEKLAEQHNAWIEFFIFPYEYPVSTDGTARRPSAPGHQERGRRGRTTYS